MKTELAIILKVVSGHYEVTESQILGKSRQGDFVLARHTAMALVRANVNPTPSFKTVAKEFNRKEHGTVAYGVRQITNFCSIYDDFKKTYNRLNATVAQQIKAAQVHP